MRSYPQTIKIFVRNFLVQFIFGGVQLGLTKKTGGRGRGTNMVEYRFVTIERLTSPIGTDQTKHAVFNWVPFGSAGRIMGDRDNQAKLIGQVLEAHFPNPAPVAIGATTVGFNQHMLLVRIKQWFHHQPPPSNSSDSKLCGIARSSDRDKALILADVVNAIGNGYALSQTWKVIHIDLPSLFPPGSTRILEIANKLPFFCVNTDGRLSTTQICLTPASKIAKLLISPKGLLTSHTFVVNSQRIITGLQQTADRWGADGIALVIQSRLNFSQRLVCPFQTRDWVSSSVFHHHFIKCFQQARLFFSTLWRPPPTARMRPFKAAFAPTISRLPRLIVSR